MTIEIVNDELIELLDQLRQHKNIKTDKIYNLMKEVDRMDFVPEDIYDRAYSNSALPFGFGFNMSARISNIFYQFIEFNNC